MIVTRSVALDSMVHFTVVIIIQGRVAPHLTVVMPPCGDAQTDASIWSLAIPGTDGLGAIQERLPTFVVVLPKLRSPSRANLEAVLGCPLIGTNYSQARGPSAGDRREQRRPSPRWRAASSSPVAPRAPARLRWRGLLTRRLMLAGGGVMANRPYIPEEPPAAREIRSPCCHISLATPYSRLRGPAHKAPPRAVHGARHHGRRGGRGLLKSATANRGTYDE